MSALEEKLSLHIRLHKLPEPVREHRFHSKRRWKFDFAWPELKLAAEVEGGTWTGGRHTRGGGFEKDCEKYNSATALGWKVYRFTSGMISNGSAVLAIENAIKTTHEISEILE
jgi:very-short-patch-repair endonuclease